MRLLALIPVLVTSMLLSCCAQKGTNPDDPYESTNRKIYQFNAAFDATMLKPPAKLYKAVLPAPVRTGINHIYDNLGLIPTVANDLLQAEFQLAIKDGWRFLINSTFGVAGIFDPATGWGLPEHRNDLGLTLAKWGNKKSPYIVLPLLGPSTIRDGMALMFEYSLLTPYPYIRDQAVLYSILGLRYIDLRSQLLDTERLMAQALDKYAFMRDAYLQNRNYLINGSQEDNNGSLYVDEEELGDYIDDDEDKAKPLAETDKTAAPETAG